MNKNKIDRIRTGVKAFIIHHGKILVIKQRIQQKEKTEIYCDIPGGGVELGESLREALMREVLEEVGLVVEVEHPVGGWEFIFKKPDENVHIVCLGYQCKLIGEPMIDTSKNPADYEEILEVLWMDKEEILNSEEIFINADMRKALEHVRI